LIGEWLASLPQWLQDAKILGPQSTVVELGCGITGLLGIVLAPLVANYLLTDQQYIMKTLESNLQANVACTSGKKKQPLSRATANLQTIALDWETDSPETIMQHIPHADSVDLVIACDCVYTNYLIPPLVRTLKDICSQGGLARPTTVMIAQQLRAEEVLELFLQAMLLSFDVWRVPDTRLPESLHSGSGYVVHLAQLKKNPKPSTQEIP
jgi:predicted nicotinamide N-methyase